jgi:elongation factor G
LELAVDERYQNWRYIDEKHPIILESMKFPAPVIGIAIDLKLRLTSDKMGMALAKLAEEDPTFTVSRTRLLGKRLFLVWVSFT